MSSPKRNQKPESEENEHEAAQSSELEKSDESDRSDDSDKSEKSDESEKLDTSDVSDQSDQSEGRRYKVPRVKSRAEAKAVLECLLFAAVEPLTLKQLRDLVKPLKENDLRALLVELQSEYDDRGSGLQVVEVAGGYQMATRPRFADYLAPFRKRKGRIGLSKAMLETLAIIAYKQPIIRAEIDAIRGVDSSGIVHALLEMELIETVGQKPVPGRPFLYGTTQHFLKHFGLKSLAELPSIESLRERFSANPG
ncbi:MAG: SMC-Scp complex subunit ScpB [Candidatus Sumerlaeia bacterium]|nr:SMC-Scp complex subunit ScpB [Candidatus Sumerlaeia bacterium]